jgi:hypothetical protein
LHLERVLSAEQAKVQQLTSALRAKVVEWRNVDTEGHAHDPAVAFAEAIVQCADELADLLASLSEAPKQTDR